MRPRSGLAVALFSLATVADRLAAALRRAAESATAGGVQPDPVEALDPGVLFARPRQDNPPPGWAAVLDGGWQGPSLGGVAPTPIPAPALPTALPGYEPPVVAAEKRKFAPLPRPLVTVDVRPLPAPSPPVVERPRPPGVAVVRPTVTRPPAPARVVTRMTEPPISPRPENATETAPTWPALPGDIPPPAPASGPDPERLRRLIDEQRGV